MPPLNKRKPHQIRWVAVIAAAIVELSPINGAKPEPGAEPSAFLGYCPAGRSPASHPAAEPERSNARTEACARAPGSRRRFLVTSQALFRSRRIHVGSGFDDLIVTTGAIPVERLLIRQRDQLSSNLKLDLRNFR